MIAELERVSAAVLHEIALSAFVVNYGGRSLAARRDVLHRRNRRLEARLLLDVFSIVVDLSKSSGRCFSTRWHRLRRRIIPHSQ